VCRASLQAGGLLHQGLLDLAQRLYPARVQALNAALIITSHSHDRYHGSQVMQLAHRISVLIRGLSLRHNAVMAFQQDRASGFGADGGRVKMRR